MKKILVSLITITLIVSGSNNLIACNNQNIENNKLIQPNFITQQPPKNSKWKLVEDKFNNFWQLQPNNKWYILFLNDYISKKLTTIKINLNINPRHIKFESKTMLLEKIYRWDGDNEPTIPTINKDTGEITNWNEKIES